MPDSSRVFAVVGAYASLSLGSAAAGVGLAELVAPGSWLARAVGLFALPIAFAAGLQAWQGLALLSLVPWLLGRRIGPGRLRASFVFLPFSSGAGALAGSVVGLAAHTCPWWLVLFSYWLLGTAQGLLAWQFARRGLLWPPE